MKPKKLYNVSFCSQLGQYLAIHDNTLRYLAIPDNTFTILSNTKQHLPIPNNTKQYLTNLVSVGIAW